MHNFEVIEGGKSESGLARQCREQLSKTGHSLTGSKNLAEQIALCDSDQKTALDNAVAPLIAALNDCHRLALTGIMTNTTDGDRMRIVEAIRGIACDAIYETQVYVKILKDEAGE